MQNGTKNLNSEAQGASVSTPDARKSVKSPREIPPKRFYKVTMQMMEVYTSSLDVKRLRQLTHSDIYAAHNSNEAIGMAITAVTKEYQDLGGIDLTSICVEARFDIFPI